MKKTLYKILYFTINFNIYFFQKLLSIISFDYNIIKKELNYFKKILFYLNKKIVYILILFLIGSLPGRLQKILCEELKLDFLKASKTSALLLFFYAPFPFLAVIQLYFSIFTQNIVSDAAKIILIIYFSQLIIRMTIIYFKKTPVGFLEYETLYYIITLGKKDNYITKTFSNIIKKVKLLHKKYLDAGGGIRTHNPF